MRIMFQLVYSSTELCPFSADQLKVLLEKSRERNQQAGITGMLLYQRGRFLQVLEGEEEAVRTVAARIERDSRHGWISVLHEGTSERREFPDWSMGFRNLDDEPLRGHTTFLEGELRLSHISADASRAKQLLLAF